MYIKLDGKEYVEVHGYFSSSMKTKTKFPESDGYKYLVEHVVEPDKLGSESRSYYRNVSAGGASFQAVLTSRDVVKKVPTNK